MKYPVHKPTSDTHTTQAKTNFQSKVVENNGVYFQDARPEAVLQDKFQQMANSSSGAMRINNLQSIANSKTEQNDNFQNNHIVQRAIILHDNSNSPAFEKAYQIFIQALESQGGEISNYLKFVKNKSNNHNLIFRTISKKPKKSKDEGDLHGVTNVVFSGTSDDILDHMFKQNLSPEDDIEEIMKGIDPVEVMHGVDVLIDIVVSPEMTEPILLETLNHEFTVHAIEWHNFIRATFAKDSKMAMQELRARIGTMRADHDNFGMNQNQLYKNVRKTIFEAIDTGELPDFGVFDIGETQAQEFMRISREAIQQHRPKEVIMKELEEMKVKAEELSSISTIHTPLLMPRKRKPPPKKDKCCYITTACAEAKGLPDDCEELTTLRNFRDNYLIKKPNGLQLIEIYYQHSPLIVNRIRQREDEEEIFKLLYAIIRLCVNAIKQGNMEFAYQTYCEMVLRLKKLFIPEIRCELPEI